MGHGFQWLSINTFHALSNLIRFTRTIPSWKVVGYYLLKRYYLILTKIAKALAKYYDGYDKLESVNFECLLRNLTGFPIVEIRNSHHSDLDILFDNIENHCKNRHIIFAKAKVKKINSDKLKNYEESDSFFKEGVYFPIIDTIREGQYKIFILRNIWTTSEFKGDYFYNHLNYPLRVLSLFEKFTDMSVNFLSNLIF